MGIHNLKDAKYIFFMDNRNNGTLCPLIRVETSRLHHIYATLYWTSLNNVTKPD